MSTASDHTRLVANIRQAQAARSDYMYRAILDHPPMRSATIDRLDSAIKDADAAYEAFHAVWPDPAETRS